MRRNKTKKIVSGVLAVIVAFSTIVTWNGKTKQVKAADAAFVTEQLAIGDYTSEKAPKPSTEKYRNWLFAGWYEDADCTKYITDRSKYTGKQYAKFVPAEVLSVKCQNLKNTTSSTETTRMRVVTTVDSLNYREIGFDIKINSTTVNQKTKTVYKKIMATQDGVAFEYEPAAFSSSSKYFATFTLINIPNKGFTSGISLKPYWITADGTKVYGISRYSRVEDGYSNILNVPVRLYTDKEVAAGYLKVDYDETKLEYVSCDLGDVFTEMDQHDDGNTITCVGNITDVKNNVCADGMWANLRFKLKAGVTLQNNLIFAVTDEEFCNNKQEFVYIDAENKTFDVSDLSYIVTK